MSTKTRQRRRARKIRQRSNKDSKLLARIGAVLEPHGCRLTGIGPKAVGVQGDARSYGISAVVRFPESMSAEKVAEVANDVTNRVRDVTRVLRDIPLP